MSDGSYMLKPLKQKQFIDGLVFLLQEIYGIENKLVDNKVPELVAGVWEHCIGEEMNNWCEGNENMNSEMDSGAS